MFLNRKTGMPLLAFGMLLGFNAALVHGQRNLQSIPKADPKTELASFKVAEGFEVNLWAADPLLAKPTQISFDHHGRMWVSSSQTYPQLNVNQEPNDRILVLQDTDRDGMADQSSVFYDQLIIPGGVLPDGNGGAYVAHAEQLIHLHDSNNDGKADRKEVLLSGFGTEDTHHTLHRLRWGPDGLMYMLQGYYIGTHVETLYGPRRLNGGGLWSYNTRSRRLEIYSRGLVNPWGVIFDRWGQTFQTDGAGGEGINYSFPEAVFRASPYENRIMRGLNPGRPKLCGLEVISGNHFPESWQGTMLAADFRANNIDRYRVEEKDSGYESTLESDLLQSTHVSFRPIDMVMGPDGAIYVADWYSPIIQHGEVDFRDERRDQVHGRIWRITAKKRPLTDSPDYQNATISDLLDLLQRDEDWVRLHAKQVLKSRDEAKVEAAIRQWVAELDATHPEYDRFRLEALWAYQTITTKADPWLCNQLFQSDDHRVRAAVVRVIYHWPHVMERPQAVTIQKPVTNQKSGTQKGQFNIVDAINDPHPRVRREAVTALSQLKHPAAVVMATQVLNHPMDQWIDFALWRTCRILEPVWWPAFEQNQLSFRGNVNRLAFALKAIEKNEAIGPLVEILKRNPNADPAIVRLIGTIGSAEDLNVLVDIVLSSEKALVNDAALALLEAAQDRRLYPASSDRLASVCMRLFDRDDNQLVAIACRLAGYWQISDLQVLLQNRLTDRDSSAVVKNAAAMGLASLMAKQPLIDSAAPTSPNVDRVAAVVALMQIDSAEGAKHVAALLQQKLSTEHLDLLIDSIVVRNGAAGQLVQQLSDRTIPKSNALHAARFIEASGVTGKPLNAAIAKAGKLELAPRELSPEMIRNLVADLSKADIDRGAKIYQRKELTCVQCHRISQSGGVIGPDLSSIGAAAPADYLIESLLDPSKKIKEGYRASIITTADGNVVSGAVVREDTNVVIVRNAAGKETRVPKSEIESRDISRISMMPSGLTAGLRNDEFLDLIAYLASLGKQK